MPKNVLIKTNLLVGFIIIMGFLIIATINYQTSLNASKDNIEKISALTSEGIYYRLEAMFTKPVNISLTMSNDALLKEHLLKEAEHMEDESYTQAIQDYLSNYRKKYEYDSVFLISEKSSRYYNFDGIDRILSADDPENDWYYSFLESDEDYLLNVDNDEAAQNEITVFINCRIKGNDGNTLGIVGVGFQIDDMQSFLLEYAKDLGIDIYLLNKSGGIEIAADKTGWQPVNFFDVCGYPQLKEEILRNSEMGETLTYWLAEQELQNYIVAEYIPELEWILIVEHNTASLERQMRYQLYKMAFTIITTSIIVLIVITYVIRRYNKRIIELAVLIEREKQAAFRNATEQLYDDIQEVNITKNRAIGERTEQYYKNLGIPTDSPYDEALQVIANKQIKEEHRKDYVSIFSPENIVMEYNKGNTNLKYDVIANFDGSKYYWVRLMAHIYYWKDDNSIRIIIYHKNIDIEKRREEQLIEQAQIDGLTQIFNKKATEHHIKQMLSVAKEDGFCFFIFDIDNFKNINDTYGHAFGDLIISEVANIIKKHFREKDVIGRIGGDEFAVFMPVHNREWVREKAEELSAALDTEYKLEQLSCKISSSIGIAITPKEDANWEILYKNADIALYQTKERGKNGYTIYGE